MAHSSKRGRSSSSASSDDEAMANCLILLAQGPILPSSSPANSYECKTCSKCFPSFQALGGHRASHKKPKPSDLDPTASLPRPPPSSRTHECSVCGSEFSSGQALGGHMRRHRPDVAKPKRPLLSLDLNLPAPPDDDHFPFSLPPQPAVDCRY